jgi:hypothetical protein
VTVSPWLRYALVAAAALLVGVLFQRDRQAGAAARTELVRLTHERRVTDTLYRRDTVRLTVTRTIYNSSRDTLLLHLTDTVKVREFVAAADSTIRACTLVVETCEQRVAVRDSIIATLKKLQPSFWNRVGLTVGPGIVVTPRGTVAGGIVIGGTIKVWP